MRASNLTDMFTKPRFLTIFRRCVYVVTILLLAALWGFAQEATPTPPSATTGQNNPCANVPMPGETVCITRQDLIRFLQTDDQNTALKAENDAVKKAAEDLKKEIYRLQTDLAKTTGELTAQQQMVVRLSAVLDLALKNTRKKCLPLSVCIN